jgi:voltage-gated potassium channel
LVLDAADLHSLMEREPQIASHIQEAARTRIGHELVAPNGDLIFEELSEEPVAPLEVERES